MTKYDMTNFKCYNDVLEHRKKCSKWGNGFCLDCFGGGLGLFSEKIINEFVSKQRDDE